MSNETEISRDSGADSPGPSTDRKILPRFSRLPWRVIGLRLLSLVIVIAALVGGLRLRDAVWRYADFNNYHYLPDVENAFAWGKKSNELGLTRIYAAVLRQRTFDKGTFDSEWEQKLPYELDYPPLRLTIMTFWQRWVQKQYPKDVPRWTALQSPGRAADDFGGGEERLRTIRPLLRFNLAMEIASAVGMYVLVLHWRRHHGYALVAALLLWFDPTVITNAQAWPQWDIWCVPFFIWALWCGSRNWWFAAGALLATGAMLKGQLLLVAPIFVLWPLMRWQWRAVVLGIAGFLFATAIVVSPFMLQSAAPIVLMGVCVIGAGVALRWLPLKRWDHRLLLLSTVATLSVFGFGSWPGAGWAWFRVGYVTSSQTWRFLNMGNTWNIPALLDEIWKWEFSSPVKLFWGYELRFVLWAVYGVLLVFISIFIARHARRADPRFLVAATAPWLIFFIVLPQMHERYLLWAAAVSCCFVALGPGMTLIHLLITAVAWLQTVATMFISSDRHAPPPEELWSFIRGVNPGIAWGMIVIAGVVIYVACRGSPADRMRNAPVP